MTKENVKLTKKNPSVKLPAKTFVPRESLLTILLQTKDFKAIYHICLSTLISLLLNTAYYDYVTTGEIKLGFHIFASGFKNPLIGLLIWVAMFLTVLLSYVLLKIWSLLHTKLAQNSVQQNRCNKISLTILIIYYCFLTIAATLLIRRFDQPAASSAALLMELVRLLMKTHAFVRSNVPKFLNFKPHTETPPPALPTFTHFLYFLFVPTLVYKDEYPKKTTRSWSFILKTSTEFVLTLFYICFIFEKFFLSPFEDYCLRSRKWSELISQILINAIPALLIKLCAFYNLLHSWLNVFAELLHFSDREFYKDWWNSTTYAAYYKTWNTVVHDWLFTYIYKDTYEYLRPGSKHFARFMVFFISAIFHEFIISFALKSFFPIMFVQFFIFGTLLSLVRNFNFVGNVFLWYSLQLGISIQLSMYSVESYARINCPYRDESVFNYFTPRFLTCDCYIGNNKSF